MKTFLAVVSLVGLVSGIPHDYHQNVGIPLANRVRQTELASDFDGPRIVGGDAATLGDYPHMAGLVIPMPTGHMSACGGTLISHTRVLTAAHCWYGARLVTVVLGSTRLFYGGSRIDSTNVIVHEDFDMTKSLEHDIALIVIPWVAFTDLIEPINLYTATNDLTGVWATVAGFGRTGDSANLNPDQYLKHLTMQVMSNDECRQSHGDLIQNSIICTRSGPNKENICNSDSGGPLSLGSGRNGVLIGVVSFGGIRCETGAPAGFARVSYYVPWIQARM